jgi:DNA-binding transcriptional LysR family regulator
MNLDLKRLEHALTLAAKGSYAAAAEVLSLSQPALTRSIQSLERSLGMRLFDRGRSGVWPTPAGRRLLELGGPLLQQASQIENDLDLMIGLETGTLKIAVGPYAADISVGTAVSRLLNQHPKIRIEINEGNWPNMLTRVLESTIDLAIVDLQEAGAVEQLELERLPTHQAYFYCATGHPLLAKELVSLEQIMSFGLVAAALPARVVELLGGARGPADSGSFVPGFAGVRVDTIRLAQNIVRGSQSVGIATISQISEDLDAGKLAILPVVLPLMQTGYGVACLARRTLSPAAIAFVEILRSVEQEISAAERPGGRYALGHYFRV